MNRPEAVLSVDRLTSGYNVVPVIRDITLRVGRGEAVAVLGANGAGKSTLLRAISGLIRPMGGEITAVRQKITGLKAEAIVRQGLSHVAEGRRIFKKMTVDDNLRIGLTPAKLTRAERERRLEEQYDFFPILKSKADDLAGSLSGGQQQMLAISQALIRGPEIVMLDEPSTGLAPIMIEEVFEKLGAIRKNGVSILLVEQVVERTLKFVDYGYVIQGGRIRAEGTPHALNQSNAVHKAYLGEAVG